MKLVLTDNRIERERHRKQIMRLLRLAIRIVYAIATRELARRKTIAQLRNEGDGSLHVLATVLDDMIKGRFSAEEAEKIKQIEKLRRRLRISDEKVAITDYGAGSARGEAGAVVKTVGEVGRTSSRSKRWNSLLFKLVRAFRPSVCLELGTALGISAAYQAAALELNRKGKIISLEGAEALVSLAKANLKALGLHAFEIVPGRFQDSLEKVLKKNAPIDFVFIDGHHEECATVRYFNQILPALSDGAILVFDDISWSGGMERAWNTIRKEKNIRASIDLLTVGICVYSRFPARIAKSFKLTI
jgi:predicted O-methyltransferase YrrM